MKMVPYNGKKHDAIFADENKLIGYVRGDIDKSNKLWTSYVSQNREFDIGDNRFAVNKFMDWFVELECMSSVEALYEFCKQYPDAAFGEPEDKTFLFFAEDKMNSYLIKIICINNNQNFYVNAYDKTE